ncbi:MAG: redoxin domain-containing protein [Flavobacteriales bacterium]
MKQYFLASIGIAALFGFSACSGGNQKSAISGRIEGGEGKTIYLERYVNNRGVLTDSTVIGSDGKFVLNPEQALDKDFYRVMLDPRDYVVLITDSTQSVTLQAKAGEMGQTVKVSGSEDTELLHDFEKAYNEFAKKLEVPAAKLREPGLTEADVLRYKEEIVKGRKDMSDYVRRWLESNSSTPAAIAAVQVLDIRTDLPQYQKVVKDLSVTFNSTAHFRQLKQKVEFAASGGNVQGQEITDPKSMPQQKVEGVLIAAGKSVPEIALPDPKGNVRKLSDMKGKVVLIDFWASWCGPCRRENPAVVRAYDEYNKDGFEVFSVSLDKDKQKWIEAIGQDGLKWSNHVSDLMGWNSKPAADFGVHSIPFPVLLDRDGKVIAYGPNVRGPMLEAHLKQIFGR